MRFPFIDAQKAYYPFTVLCRVLRVRRSGYYAWRNRGPSQRAQTDKLLAAHITQAFHNSRGTYGSPRLRAELRAQGLRTSRRRIERLMRAQCLCTLRLRRKVRTTDSRHRLPIAQNRLRRDFSAPAPNRVWITAVTFIWTHTGWLYLAVLLDLFSRRVVGYAMSPHNDEEPVLLALRRASRVEMRRA
jgi:transposase InsO family protein